MYKVLTMSLCKYYAIANKYLLCPPQFQGNISVLHLDGGLMQLGGATEFFEKIYSI